MHKVHHELEGDGTCNVLLHAVTLHRKLPYSKWYFIFGHHAETVHPLSLLQVFSSEFSPVIPAFFQCRNRGIENGSIPDMLATSRQVPQNLGFVGIQL